MNVNPDDWGVATHYNDASGARRDTPPDSVEHVLQALGANTEPVPGENDGPLVITEGSTNTFSGPWSIVLESGQRLDGDGSLPQDLPLGYHRLSNTERSNRLLIVAPEACPSMSAVRWWGWTIQLYASRSDASWGIGDFGDLREFARFASQDGARFGVVNPLHAGLPDLPQEASPYYPSSREFRNPLYLRIEDVPGATKISEVNEAARAGRALNGQRLIKRDEIWKLKLGALRKIWSATETDSDFHKYVADEGDGLYKYATFCALADHYGRPWQDWPIEFRHPHNPEVENFSQQYSDEVRFHQWLQWLCERQFGAATQFMPFVQDLAIGVNPAGADAWLWQDVMALGVRVGAPPDEFNTQGQDWAIPPFDPWKLRRAEYEPFIRTVRAALRSGGGVRIDHVMGLFRLYWIPEGSSAADGAYVHYPYQDLLAILALESSRNGGIVVGEDLGTIEHYMREELARRNVLSYKLMWFERDKPSDYPVNTLGAITTHDLPTIAGLFSDRDLEIQRDLGTSPNVEATMEMKRRVGEWLGVDQSTSITEMVRRAHELLAGAQSAVVAATVEDALGLEERPNYPGTTDQWPNWSVALPVAINHLQEHPGYQATVAAFSSVRPAD
jgi:4-alpha-glucanotransferase